MGSRDGSREGVIRSNGFAGVEGKARLSCQTQNRVLSRQQRSNNRDKRYQEVGDRELIVGTVTTLPYSSLRKENSKSAFWVKKTQ